MRLALFTLLISTAVAQAEMEDRDVAGAYHQVAFHRSDGLQRVGAATKAAWATGHPAEALANAVPYMQAFGHTVLAWIWLDVALSALSHDAAQGQPATVGRLAATRYFFHYELPKIAGWLPVVESRDPTCAELPEEAF